ncbi:MAG: hypothetical protein GY701_09715 [Sulfitobacter sp.]|nr:hypothetical protein [Sulfitobacter sp.]
MEQGIEYATELEHRFLPLPRCILPETLCAFPERLHASAVTSCERHELRWHWTQIFRINEQSLACWALGAGVVTEANVVPAHSWENVPRIVNVPAQNQCRLHQASQFLDRLGSAGLLEDCCDEGSQVAFNRLHHQHAHEWAGWVGAFFAAVPPVQAQADDCRRELRQKQEIPVLHEVRLCVPSASLHLHNKFVVFGNEDITAMAFCKEPQMMQVHLASRLTDTQGLGRPQRVSV